MKSTLDNKALLSNPSQAPLASLQEKRSVFSDTKCEHKTCPEGDGIWNEDITVIDFVKKDPRTRDKSSILLFLQKITFNVQFFLCRNKHTIKTLAGLTSNTTNLCQTYTCRFLELEYFFCIINEPP